jgi:exodeoxyribonuclease VII small subunit
MSRKKNSPLDFESALAELNNIINKMETGSLTLENSLAQFERGILLTRQCQKALSDAEQKIKILVQEDGDSQLESYENT